MSTRTVLFGERAAGVYLLTEIYDPDIDGANVSSSGKIVPAVGSQIVDNTKGLHNQLYTVVAVDQSTYKVSMVPSTYVVDSTAQVDRVLSYGNDIFMLYFSPATIKIGTDNVTVTRLIVDNKLSLFGNHAATYQLTATDNNGNETIISRWYDATGVAKGSAIPMLETGVEGIRKCDGCYTDAIVNEGDVVTCRIYSAAGIMIAQIQLIAKAAHFLNESISSANPIVGLEVVANQMFEDGTLYLFQNQNVEELAIFVKLHYANGIVREIAVNNRDQGYVYGLEEIRTDVVDETYPLTVKYYLGNNDVTDENAYVYNLTTDTTVREGVVYYTRTALANTWQYSPVATTVGEAIPANTYYERTVVEYNNEINADGAIRFIARHTTVRIVTGTQDLISKLSVIPIWMGTASGWTLKFAYYRKDRIAYSSTKYPITLDGYDPLLYGEKQNVTINTHELVNGIKTPYTQNFVIELREPGDITSTTSENIYWLIADDAADKTPYGSGSPKIRPRIYYDDKRYTIPSSVFTGNTVQSAVEVFLENFYYNANPPTTANESAAPEPTHFIVKTSDGVSLMTNRKEVVNFTGDLKLDLGGGLPNRYVGSTLLVEFSRDFTYVETEDTVAQAGKIYYERVVTSAGYTRYDIHATLAVGDVIPANCYEQQELAATEYLYGVPVSVVDDGTSL